MPPVPWIAAQRRPCAHWGHRQRLGGGFEGDSPRGRIPLGSGEDLRELRGAEPAEQRRSRESGGAEPIGVPQQLPPVAREPDPPARPVALCRHGRRCPVRRHRREQGSVPDGLQGPLRGRLPLPGDLTAPPAALAFGRLPGRAHAARRASVVSPSDRRRTTATSSTRAGRPLRDRILRAHRRGPSLTPERPQPHRPMLDPPEDVGAAPADAQDPVTVRTAAVGDEQVPGRGGRCSRCSPPVPSVGSTASRRRRAVLPRMTHGDRVHPPHPPGRQAHGREAPATPSRPSSASRSGPEPESRPSTATSDIPASPRAPDALVDRIDPSRTAYAKPRRRRSPPPRRSTARAPARCFVPARRGPPGAGRRHPFRPDPCGSCSRSPRARC